MSLIANLTPTPAINTPQAADTRTTLRISRPRVSSTVATASNGNTTFVAPVAVIANAAAVNHSRRFETRNRCSTTSPGRIEESLLTATASKTNPIAAAAAMRATWGQRRRPSAASRRLCAARPSLGPPPGLAFDPSFTGDRPVSASLKPVRILCGLEKPGGRGGTALARGRFDASRWQPRTESVDQAVTAEDRNILIDTYANLNPAAIHGDIQALTAALLT